MKIAILDTGIDVNHEYLKDNIIGGIAFESKGNSILISDDYNDDNGHGTSCASIIKKEFEDVEIFAVKILDKEGESNIQVLEESLRYLLDLDIKIINLSLSVIDSNDIYDLKKICDQLIEQGKIIVCSLANGYEKSFPAIFDNIIGVKGFILEDENCFWYNKSNEIQCIMDNNSYMCCDINNTYRLFGKSNSQAAAKFTGKIANILLDYGDMRFYELNNRLQILSKREYWNEEDLKASKRYPILKNELSSDKQDIFDKTMAILIDFFYSEKEYISNKSLYNIGLNDYNCFELIKIVQQEFNIKLNYLNISRYDFLSIYTLVNLINKVSTSFI